jgi:hypothetical protein
VLILDRKRTPADLTPVSRWPPALSSHWREQNSFCLAIGRILEDNRVLNWIGKELQPPEPAPLRASHGRPGGYLALLQLHQAHRSQAHGCIPRTDPDLGQPKNADPDPLALGTDPAPDPSIIKQ